MQSIAKFIVANIDININTDEVLDYSVIQNGVQIKLDDLSSELFKVIDKNEISDFTLFPENLGFQREKIISFKWHDKICEIGEHFGTQRDYFWVEMSQVI